MGYLTFCSVCKVNPVQTDKRTLEPISKFCSENCWEAAFSLGMIDNDKCNYCGSYPKLVLANGRKVGYCGIACRKEAEKRKHHNGSYKSLPSNHNESTNFQNSLYRTTSTQGSSSSSKPRDPKSLLKTPLIQYNHDGDSSGSLQVTSSHKSSKRSSTLPVSIHDPTPNSLHVTSHQSSKRGSMLPPTNNHPRSPTPNSLQVAHSHQPLKRGSMLPASNNDSRSPTPNSLQVVHSHHQSSKRSSTLPASNNYSRSPTPNSLETIDSQQLSKRSSTLPAANHKSQSPTLSPKRSSTLPTSDKDSRSNSLQIAHPHQTSKRNSTHPDNPRSPTLDSDSLQVAHSHQSPSRSLTPTPTNSSSYSRPSTPIKLKSRENNSKISNNSNSEHDSIIDRGANHSSKRTVILPPLLSFTPTPTPQDTHDYNSHDSHGLSSKRSKNALYRASQQSSLPKNHDSNNGTNRHQKSHAVPLISLVPPPVSVGRASWNDYAHKRS
ncbi:3197_t:CDS:1 [Acaulospora colombiana]|uniref:3197_t:CDS:1 n=1 Tax=Acaulospora colombiana TaxID=27376 RepID=A0ACA9KN48_9GLOM|nr:3197_t:CDS:1 [Acaulospora colombiana]